MANLDRRIDPDKDKAKPQSGRVKDGVSGNVNESLEYEDNKVEDLPHGPAPDIPPRSGEPGPRRS